MFRYVIFKNFGEPLRFSALAQELSEQSLTRESNAEAAAYRREEAERLEKQRVEEQAAENERRRVAKIRARELQKEKEQRILVEKNAQNLEFHNQALEKKMIERKENELKKKTNGRSIS